MTTRTLRSPSAASRLPTIILWVGASMAAGIFIGTQRLEYTLVAMALLVFGVCAAITPLAALMVMLVFAPLRTLIATESSLNLPLDIGQWTLIAAFGSWIALSIIRERRLPRWNKSPIFIPVGIFFIAITLTGFVAQSMGFWLSEWLKWAQVGVIIAFCLSLRGIRTWEWLLFGVVAAAFANALVGIYEFFGGSGALHLLISENSRFFRAFGTFGQPNPFGGFMGLIAPIALVAAFASAKRVWHSWHIYRRIPLARTLAFGFYAVASACITIALFMSWSRGAWLAFILAMGAVTFALPHRKRHGIAILIVIAAAVAGLWATGRLPVSITDRISSAIAETFNASDVRGVNISPENYAVVERLAHWQAALNMARAKPWLGVGFGNYEAAYEDYRLINWNFPLGHAHNYYLNILAEAGIIGLTAYVTMWIGIFGLTWRARHHPDPFSRAIAVGLLGSWVYLSAHSLTDNLYVNNVFLHLGVLLGILAILFYQRFPPPFKITSRTV